MSPIAYRSQPPPSAELVIVGGGVVGAATAFFAARAGLRAVLVERRPALATLTTAASTGAFRLQFDNEEEWRLIAESVELFLDFGEVTRQNEYDLGIKQQGYLWVTTDERRAERQRNLVELQRSWGQRDIDVLTGDEVRQQWPYVGPDVVQARFRAGDGFLDPKQLTLGLAAGSDVEVVTDCAATGFLVDRERVRGVLTNKGTIEADAVAVATGPLSAPLLATAGIALPIHTVPRHKVVMPDVPLVPSHAPMTIDDDTGAHWRPALAGAYLLYTDPATPATEAVEDVAPDHRLAFALLRPESPVSVARIAPFWRTVWEHAGAHWLIHSGLYTMTPDRRPLLGPTEIEGLYVNTGYSGHGIMGSAAGSRHFVDVLTGKIPPRDNTFALDRTFAPRDTDLL